MRRERHPGNGGFTLVEVLVAVLVLAVGLLGLAGLQLASMKSNHSAYRRSQATIAAYDLLDRMRANPGEFVGRTFTYADDGCGEDAAFAQWECLIDSLGLPAPKGEAGRGGVDCSDGNACGDGNCEVVISWDDSRGERAAGDANRASTTIFRVCSRIAEEV
jgi:type IV pilus assembly protein PilV